MGDSDEIELHSTMFLSAYILSKETQRITSFIFSNVVIDDPGSYTMRTCVIDKDYEANLYTERSNTNR